METPQPAWGTCATVREKTRFLLGSEETSYISVCVVLSLVPLRRLILFSSLDPQLSFLSLSSYSEMLQFLTHPHDSLSFNTSMSPLYWEVQSFRSITDQGRVTSLHLLATPCLIRLRKPFLLAFSAARAHCGFMVNLCSPGLPGHSLLSSFLARQSPSCTSACGYSLG